MKHIPVEIVHGRFDMLCSLQYVMELHTTLSESRLTIVDAGHAPTEIELEEQMVKSLN